jgi:hypothetical protein
MQVISYEITRWRLEGEDVQVTELGPYSEVVAETCNYIRSSLDDTSYMIRVTTDYELHEVQIDELEQTLNELPRGLDFLASVELVMPENIVEKTVRIEKITRSPIIPLPRSESERPERPDDEELREDEDRYEREEMEREKWDEWTRGGGQGCGNCIDVCRCMSRGYDSDY